MSIKQEMQNLLKIEEEIDALGQEIDKQQEILSDLEMRLDNKYVSKVNAIEKRYNVEVELFVQELAKLWNLPVEELQIRTMTNIFSKENKSETQMVCMLHGAVEKGVGELRVYVTVGNGDDEKRVSLLNRLNLNTIQKDGKSTKEHLVLVHDQKAGMGFKFDDYRKMVLGFKFVNQPAIDENGNVIFDSIRDQACYNAVMAKENSAKEEIEMG
ncbi:MAG: hypothetical protein IJZ62_03450 [Clostridia bacterium]|nr:hypothetical protein [Clostridia bacterium]